jgi:hypothetical protein
MTNKLKHQLTSKHAWLMYLARLKQTIGNYGITNGWTSIDNYRERKIDGKIVWSYNDWERIEDMYITIYNDKQHGFNCDKCYDELYDIECKYKEVTS